jgi:hypothetical protein
VDIVYKTWVPRNCPTHKMNNGQSRAHQSNHRAQPHFLNPGVAHLSSIQWISEALRVRIIIVPERPDLMVLTIPGPAERSIHLGNNDSHYVWLRSLE